MSSSTTRITIIAETGEDCAEIRSQIVGLPDTELRTNPGQIGRMNGSAVSIMGEDGIVVTRFTGAGATELETIEQLVSSDAAAARMIVLSDADLSLSVARRLMQAGVADVLPMPVEPADLRRAIQRLTKPADLPVVWNGRAPGRILTVARARGGIGATTVAVNLADALAKGAGRLRKSNGPSVAIVDLDLQFGAVASFLNISARDTLYDIAAGEASTKWSYLDEEMETAENGVRVLTAPQRFVPFDALQTEQVGTILEVLRERFDYVVVDLPHGLVDWVQAVIDRSDRVYLVTDSTVPAIRQSKRLVDFFQEESPGIPLEIVINHEAKPLIQAKHHTQAAKLLGQQFQTWLPPDPKVARAALDRGVPLSTAGRRSPLCRSIARLARSVKSEFGASTNAAVRPH